MVWAMNVIAFMVLVGGYWFNFLAMIHALFSSPLLARPSSHQGADSSNAKTTLAASSSDRLLTPLVILIPSGISLALIESAWN